MDAFEKIISKLDKSLSVLDVGAGGQVGYNTTNALLAHFTDVTLINNSLEKTKEFREKNPEVPIIIDDFYTYKFDKKFDLIVLDLGKKQSIQDWREKVLNNRVKNLLTQKGMVITYIHGEDEDYEMFDIQREQRRPEISWVAFKRKYE